MKIPEVLPEIMTPGLPPVHFESLPPAVAGLVVLAAGAATTYGVYKQHQAMIAERANFADPDQSAIAGRHIRRQMGLFMGSTILASVTLGGVLLDMANPYTDHTNNKVHNVAVVVDASYNAYTQDVTDGNSGTQDRLDAAVNGISSLGSLSGINVTFIAAGQNAESMGTVSDGNGVNPVIQNFTNYTSNYGSRAGYDLKDALAIAQATKPDKVLVIGDVAPAADSPLLQNQAKPGSNDVSTILLGKQGSKVDYIGQQVDASYDKQGNDAVVGATDSYTADSEPALQKIVEHIVQSQYQEKHRSRSDYYAKIRDVAGEGLAALALVMGGAMAFPRRKSSNSKEV